MRIAIGERAGGETPRDVDYVKRNTATSIDRWRRGGVRAVKESRRAREKGRSFLDQTR